VRNQQTQYEDEDEDEAQGSESQTKFQSLPCIFREKFSNSYSIAHTTASSEHTYSQYYASSLKYAKSMLEMKDSSKFQACGIWLSNQKEYCEVYMACLMIGFVPVGVYETLEKMGLAHLVRLSQMQWIILNSEAQLDALLEVHAELGKESKLQIVIMLQEGFESDRRDSVEVYNVEDFLSLGEYISEQDVVARTDLIQPDDVATLIFTSGTTGLSKAVKLSHKNLVYMAEQMTESTVRQMYYHNPALVHDEQHNELRFVSYLPLAHIAEQLITILIPAIEATNVHFIRNRLNLLSEVQSVRPTAFMGVPRVWEKIHTGLQARISNLGFFKRTLIQWGMNTTYTANQILKCHGASLDPFMAFKYRVARYLAIDKIRTAIGLNKCYCFVSGAGPLSADLAKFFSSIDIVIQESYGQSEGVGVVCFNQLGAIKFGTVGKPLKGMHVKIAEDTEILIKGPAVFLGYLSDPKSTQEALTEDMYLKTGDLGAIDEQGFVRITGRKKDIIITSGGKNISPALIENLWKSQSPIVSDVVVVGDNKPFLTAIVSLDEDYAVKHLEEAHGKKVEKSDLCTNALVQRLVAQSMQSVNAKLSQVEKIKKFVISPEAFSTKNGVLTDTLKVKRANVNDRYKKLIDSMYTPRS